MKTFKTNTDAHIPALGLGTWKMTDEEAASSVQTAIETGYRHVDCAWIYQNEKGVGQAFNACIRNKTVKRDDLWVTSKLWNDRHRPEHVEDALKESLGYLNLSHLDLYLIHWPIAQTFGVARPESGTDYVGLDEVPIVETWQALEECVAKGLCKNIGVSNFSASKIDALMQSAKIKPVMNQVECHPFLQQKNLQKTCQAHDILLTAYSPLGSGDRPDNLKNENEPSLLKNETLNSIAREHNATAAQVLLAWAIQRGTIPIPKSSNAQRQKENLAAAELQLTADQTNSIDALDANFRYVDGKFWEVENSPYTAASIWDE